MKRLNLILSIIIAALLSACGNDNQENGNNTKTQNADSTKTVTEQTKDEDLSNVPYMTFITGGMEGMDICFDVKYPKNETVWIDWNNNKKLDEGEKLDSAAWKLDPSDVYTDGYSVDKKLKQKSSDFTVYGAVTYLYCPEAAITEMDISHNPYLENLQCHDNDIKSLDISKNKNLKVLCCIGTNLTKLDISNNPNLEHLRISKDIESKVFNFTPYMKKIEKVLNKQNLIPKGYHIVNLAYNENYSESEARNDKLIYFEVDIPYAKRKEVNEDEIVDSKLIYFKSLGNNKYKIIGEEDNLRLFDVAFKNENHIIEREWESMEECNKTFYNVKDGKIVKTPAVALNSVKPNADGIYEVNTANELLGSIGSNRTIKIMKKEILFKDIDFGYVKSNQNDYFEELRGITFNQVENLTIIGGLEEMSELVLENKENTILIFKDSKNISLQNMRIGHQPSLDCFGGVLAFLDCKKVNLDNMVLYGCGIKGLTTYGIEDLHCSNLKIEHCSINALCLHKCNNAVFDNFEFTDNIMSELIIVDKSNNITFKNGVIKNNECNPIISVDKESKSIVFEKVEMKDNKVEKISNTEDESIVKFIE